MKTKPNDRLRRRSIAIGLAALAGVLAAGIGWVVRMASAAIPKPDGAHQVGFRSTLLVDPSRMVTRNGRTMSRTLTLDTWYPAASIDGRPRVPYIDAATAEQLQKLFGLPATSETPSHSYLDAPLRAGRYPVVIFNHGYGAFTRQNFSLCEMLASHGYLVIAIGRAGESATARDADDALVNFDVDDPSYREIADAQRSDGAAMAATLARIMQAQRQAASADAHDAASRDLANALPYRAMLPMLRAWALDVRFTIDSLDRVAGADPSRVVLMGHSFGSAVSMDVARAPGSDAVKGVINLDAPWLRYDGESSDRLAVPALLMLSTENKMLGHDLSVAGAFDAHLRERSPGAHVIEIAGTGHFNFSDLGYIRLLKFAGGMLGSADGAFVHEQLNQAVLAFAARAFNERDVSQPLLTSDDPRVRQAWYAPR
jgi:dienelactone hydrolase